MNAFTRLPDRGLAVLRDPDGGIFLGIALLVGVAVGVGAAVLIWVLEFVEALFHDLGGALTGGATWFVLISVPVGLLGAWFIARRFAPEVAGDGVPEVTIALAIRAGYLSTKSIPLKILATALTLGGGGSAGREGPIVQIGGAIGSSLSRRFGLGEDKVRSLLAAGAAAGIGATFNAPIAGMLFGLEVILGSFAVRHMSAVVLASISAAVTFRSLVPEAELLSASNVEYQLHDWRELFLYAGLAVLAVIAAVLFLRFLELVERPTPRRAIPAWLRPVAMGLVIAALGMFEPRLLGTGQGFVSQLLATQDASQQLGVVGFGTSLLLLLALGKMATTSLTIAAGGSGGAFMPSLFIGAVLGAGYAQLVDPYWTTTNLSTGAFAVVGMATVFAAVARAPLTAILIVFEVTGARDYGLILPLMLSATFATFVADRIHPESVYTMPLKRRGIKLRRTSDVDLLDSVTVGEVMGPVTVTVSSTMSVEDAAELMDRHRHHGLPVVDGDALVGVVTITDLRRIEQERAGTPVAAVMTTKPITVGPATPVSEAMERMAVLEIGRLPVVSDDRGHTLVGLFRREDAIRAYHYALSASTGALLDRDRFRQRIEPDAAYYDFRVPAGSIADRRAVRDIRWPPGSTLVSVRRGTMVLIPDGATELWSGDVVTAFGTTESKQRMIERMNTGADEPTAEIRIEEIETNVSEAPDAP